MSEKLEINNENKETKDTNEDQKNASKTVANDCVFSLKRWNLVAMWSWDVECEVCAICRTPLMGIFRNNSIF
jgi:RING-box protein 2